MSPLSSWAWPRRVVPVALVVVVVVLLLFSTVSAPAAGNGRPSIYAAPVDAPVIDPFRPPSFPYGPGNRGIEYATAPGTVVRAAGAGRVSFAGAVARSLQVTLSHPDGIRTSYSFLAEVTVARGMNVRQGDVVGIAGARLHVGARRGDDYIDPASLWGSVGPPHVELVPLDGGGARPSPFRSLPGFGWRWW